MEVSTMLIELVLFLLRVALFWFERLGMLNVCALVALVCASVNVGMLNLCTLVALVCARVSLFMAVCNECTLVALVCATFSAIMCGPSASFRQAAVHSRSLAMSAGHGRRHALTDTKQAQSL